MACYRLYHITGEHFSGFDEFEASDDAQAVAEAEHLNGAGEAELWRGGQKIKRLSPRREAVNG